MTVFRLCIGGGALLLSMAGLLVCIAGVLVVWMLKSRIDVVGRALFEAADEAVDFVDAKLALVNQLLQKSRQRIRRITRVAERLMDARADARKEIEPLLPILDEVSQQWHKPRHPVSPFNGASIGGPWWWWWLSPSFWHGSPFRRSA
jgi:hypothetical protein